MLKDTTYVLSVAAHQLIFFANQALTSRTVIGGSALGPVAGSLERTEVSSILLGGATFVVLLILESRMR